MSDPKRRKVSALMIVRVASVSTSIFSRTLLTWAVTVAVGDRERDRLLKGQFFQDLHPRWQRKLGAPKGTESFTELYVHARTSEQHEQQFRINSRPKDPPKAREKKDGNSPSTIPSQSSGNFEDSVFSTMAVEATIYNQVSPVW